MNAKVSFRGQVSKLQKAFLVVMVVMILCGSFPAGNARAASSKSFRPVVWCNTGSFSYQFSAVGDYYNQLIYYHLFVYAVQPDGKEILLKELPSSTTWYQVRAVTTGDWLVNQYYYPQQQFTAPKNTNLRVKTFAMFWNNVYNRWDGPYLADVAAHNYYNTYFNMYMNGSSCLVS